MTTTKGIEALFIAEHWGTLQMLLADPDGREISIEAPLSEGAKSNA